MRILIIAFLLAQLCAVAAEPRKNPPLGRLLAERGVVLPAEAAPKLFRQCSRPAPAFSGKLWTPTPADLAQLESGFPAYYESKTKFRSMTLDAYYRQYAGFISADGRRLIYANFSLGPFPRRNCRRRIRSDGIRTFGRRPRRSSVMAAGDFSASCSNPPPVDSRTWN